MKNALTFLRWVLAGGAGLLAPAAPVLAQAPLLTGVVPLANAVAAAPAAPLVVSFNQAVPAGAGAALRVFSSQRGGLRSRGTTPSVASGNTLRYTPASYPFRPNETVRYTVAAGAVGNSPAWVGQFTAAAGGTGRGTFLPGPNYIVGVAAVNCPIYLNTVAAADVDGDGDLDILSCENGAGTIRIVLNNGRGVIAPGTAVYSGGYPREMAVGDVDGDGDLDLCVNIGSGQISTHLNNGAGAFAYGTYTALDGTSGDGVTLGDVDGDGDLDLAAVNGNYGTTNRNTVSIRRNDGRGNFSGTHYVAVAPQPYKVVLADVDNDGDLDLLTNSGVQSGAVSVRLNNGTGVFSGSQNVAVGGWPKNLAVGDVDGDGDLDLLTVNDDGVGSSNCTVSVCHNNGSGLFALHQTVGVGSGPYTVALGDVDSDGDLDFVTADNNSSSQVSLRLNDGTGTFSGSTIVPVFYNATAVALADVDDDLDLDLVCINYSGSMSVRLNGGTVLGTARGQVAAGALRFPNPVVAGATVPLLGAQPGTCLVLTDPLGRPVARATAAANGRAQLVLPNGLAPGVYLLGNGGQTQRLVVE